MRASRFQLLSCSLALALVAVGLVVSGVNAAPTGEPNETAYRRVFVPANDPDAWPTAGQRYLPLAEGDFQQLVKQADEVLGQSADAARLLGATYRAELVNDVLKGAVTFEVAVPGEGPRIVPLEPWNLVVTSAAWQGENPSPVQWGLWNRGSQVNVSGVLATRSGKLQMNWQATATVADGQQSEFTLDTPPIALQTLELVLPADYQAMLPTAELVRTQAEPGGAQRWLFRLASHGPHQLKLLRQSAAKPLPRLSARVSQTTVYRIEPEGLSVITSFRVEPESAGGIQLRCSLAEGVQIKSVSLERGPILWHREDAGECSVDIPAAQHPQELVVEALAPVELNRHWQLPTIRPLNAEWTEGTSLVVVSPQLELQSFSAESAALQHIVGLQPSSGSTEAYRLQEWSPESSVELIVGQPQQRLSVEAVTAIDSGANETTARISTRISGELRPSYQIAAPITSGWSIESVKSTPTSAVREWHIEDEGEQAVLILQLSQAIKQGHSLQVEFGARMSDRRGGNSERPFSWDAAKLRVLRVENATARELVLLRTQPQRQVELARGLERARVSPAELSASERELLPEPLVGELLDLTRLTSAQTIELRPQRPHYEVEVGARLVVLPQTSTHEYEIECGPVAAGISEVTVRFDEPISTSAEWTLTSQNGAQRRLEATLQEDTTDGATYLVKLPVEATGAVRLKLSYSAAAEEATVYNAISFPQADRWSGRLEVRGPLDGLMVSDVGWVPVGWGKAHEAEESGSLASCYRLDSEQSSRNTPLAVRRKVASDDSTPLSAWLAEYQTHQAADGAAICTAVYDLENSGASELQLKLPSDAELQAVWLDAQQLEPRDLETDKQTYQVRLTDSGRYPTLTLQYAVRGPALGRTTTISPILPTCSFPIRLSRWTLWTPGQYMPDDQKTGYSARRIPWRERLFGPLARDVGQEVFLPWRAKAWPELWSTPVEGLRTRLLAERFGNRLERQLSISESETWGELLSQLSEALRAGEIISVDAAALRAESIEPSTRVYSMASAGAATEGRQLASYGLALLVSPSRIVVTTVDRVAHWRDQLQPTSAPRVFAVTTEELAQGLEARSSQRGNSIVPISDWISSGAALPTPWSGAMLTGLSDVGQRACTVEFIGEVPSVVVRRAYAQEAYWYVLWLATIVGATWWLGHGQGRFILALAAVAALCFVTPVYWLTLPQAVFVGFLSALVLQLIFARPVRAANEWSTQAFVPRTAPLAILLFASLYATHASGAPAAGALPRVLVPIDAEGNRQGEDVYVSEAFLERLERARGAADHDGTRYSLSNLSIRGSLPSGAAGIDETWTLRLAIETFVPTTEIELPLEQSDGQWLIETATLDGQPVTLNWRPENKGCWFKVQSIGRHQLTLGVRPRIAELDAHRHIQLHLPHVAGTQLELAASEELKDIRILGAGSIIREDGRLRTALAATDALEVDWAPTRGQAPPLKGDVEQLSWLRVEGAFAQLAVRYHFQELAAPLRTLDLEIPSELKLLPPGGDSPVERTEPLGTGQTRLHMKAGWETGGRVPLEFRLQRVSSFGRFFMPNIRLSGFAPERKLFAVSVAPELAYHEEASESLHSLSPDEFLAAWGETNSAPLLAYSVGASATDWSLRIWPAAPTLIAEQSLALHCETDGARVEYRAVNQVAGKWLIHRLRISPELEVDGVSVIEQSTGEAVPVRWSRPSSSQVTVFLSRPLTQSHVLRLRGRLQTSADGSVSVPHIVLDGAERGETRLAVWRNPQVLTEWVDPSTVPRELARPIASPDSAEILVGRYVWRNDDPASEKRIHLRPNDLQFTADTVTSLDENSRGRSLSLRTHLKVVAGVMDQVEINAPANFAEPYELQPASIATVGHVNEGADRRHVAIVFNESVATGKSVDLQLSGRLIVPTDGRVEMPEVEVVGVAAGKRYVLLPTRLADRDIEWQIEGLRRESLPEDLRNQTPPSSAELPYRIVGSSFTAREPIYQGPLRSAAVRHAWVEGVLDASGNLSATASLVLQPGRATHCSVRLPAGARLLGIVADDQPASRQPLADGSWRVALGPPFLPRVIKVSYLAVTGGSSTRTLLAPPELLIGDAALPLPATDWQIGLAQGQRMGEASVGHKISGAKYAENRQRDLASALEDAAAIALESPEDEVRPWFAAWRAQIEAATDEARNWGGEPATLDFQPALEAEATSWTQLAQKMGDMELLTMLSTTAYPPTVPQRPAATLDSRSVFMTSDGAGQVEIVRAPLSTGNIWRWIAAATILALGLMLEKRAPAGTAWLDALGRWPHALTLGAGLIWWTLFSPSIVGLVLMALVAASLIVEYVRRQRALRAVNISTQLTARVS